MESKKETRIQNQDMPVSSMTKFEMAVLGNVKGLLSTQASMLSDKQLVEDAIDLAKETFKQLEELK